MNAMLKGVLAALAAALILGSAGTAWTMGGPSSSPAAKSSSEDPDYAAGASAAQGGRYDEALAHLKKVVERNPKNADAWNYIGFSERKLGKFPDALSAYEKALAINPGHLGANEYLGELYLATGDMPKAQERLARLAKLCNSGCAEYRALKSAIDAKKSS